MLMKKSIVLFFAILITQCLFSQNKISIGERFSVSSKVLNDERAISVYYPPSYFFKANEKFPVLYILDGDYNFQYVAGLLELWGGISEDIPEMILVAISGKGTNTYRKNCKPNFPNIKDAGNADRVIDFIQNELIPFVDCNFKSNGYKILAGHSVGGIFVSYTALKNPHLFNHYIAISPALWWSDNAMETIFKKKYTHKILDASIYFSLADEKGMGVKRYLKLIKNTSKNYRFKQFPDENHNSTGNKAYQWALQDIFKPWKVEKEYFSNVNDVKNYFELQKSTFSQIFKFPSGIIANTNYMLKSKPKRLHQVRELLWKNSISAGIEMNNQIVAQFIEDENFEKANSLLDKIFHQEPHNFKALENLAKLYFKKNKLKMAEANINLSIKEAIQQNARQWMINELLETKIMME